MRRVFLSAALAALLVACTPPAEQPSDTSDTPGPQVQACNTITPDNARMVRVEEAQAVASVASDLPGGPIVPGVYDLIRAVRIGQATGWQDARAVALEVSEGESGVIFQWAGAPASGEVDRWTASFTDTPRPSLRFTCGRIGDVEPDFTASGDALQLRVPDGANGSLLLDFVRRS